MGLTFGDVGCRQASTTAHWVSCSSTFRKGSPAWSGTHSARRLALLTSPARSRCASSRWAIGLVAFTMPFLKLILPVRCRSRRRPSFLAPFQCMRRVHTATSQTITSGLFSVDFVLQMCRYVYLRKRIREMATSIFYFRYPFHIKRYFRLRTIGMDCTLQICRNVDTLQNAWDASLRQDFDKM